MPVRCGRGGVPYQFTTTGEFTIIMVNYGKIMVKVENIEPQIFSCYSGHEIFSNTISSRSPSTESKIVRAVSEIFEKP